MFEQLGMATRFELLASGECRVHSHAGHKVGCFPPEHETQKALEAAQAPSTGVRQPSLRSLRRLTHGAAVFPARGCQRCHTIHDVGVHNGHYLSGVGRGRLKEAIRRQIVPGSKAMPAFGKVLGPEELNDLLVYMRSCCEKQAELERASGPD
jgi:mono/diheme cytochrome c family protein